MSRFPFMTVIVAAAVLIIFGVYAFSFKVRFSDVVVKETMGRVADGGVYNANGDDPGLKFRWPWPIDTLTHYDRRLQTIDTSETEIKTRDGKNIIVGAYGVWRVGDALRFHRAARTEAAARDQMRARLAQAMAAVMGAHDMRDFVNTNAADLDASYERIEQELLAEAAGGLDRDYGIELLQFNLRRISLPAQTTQTVFDQMRKEREEKATEYRQQGESIAAAIKAEAEANARQILAFADRRAQQIRSEGVAAATRIFRQIDADDREFFQYLRWLDAAKAALEERVTFFIDSNSPFYQMLMSPGVPRFESTPQQTSADDESPSQRAAMNERLLNQVMTGE